MKTMARARLGVEEVLSGGEPVALDDELLVIPVPGHTRGHAVLLYRDRFLFRAIIWRGRQNEKR